MKAATIKAYLTSYGALLELDNGNSLSCSGHVKRLWNITNKMLGRNVWITISTTKPSHNHWIALRWSGFFVKFYDNDGKGPTGWISTPVAFDQTLRKVKADKNRKLYFVLEVPA